MKRLVLMIILSVTILAPLPIANAAVGDAVASCSSVSSLATLDVQPGAGIEWVIHSLYFEDTVELQRYDGSLTAIFATLTGPDWKMFSPAIHLTNTNRIRVKNNHGSLAKVICYDGVVVK